MATRLYGVPSTAAPVSPGFGAWTTTAQAVRRSLSLTKSGTAETLTNVSVTSGAGNNALAFQLVSEPLGGAQTITGTVTIVTRGRELATQDNIQSRVRTIKVYSQDGNTLRGTLLALGAHSVTTELGTTLAGYPAASAQALSSVSAQNGDRIVVEIGYGMTTTGTTPLYDMSIGGTGTDHANSEGDATGTIPWVEFSQNLNFQANVDLSPLTFNLSQGTVSARPSVALSPLTFSLSQGTVDPQAAGGSLTRTNLLGQISAEGIGTGGFTTNAFTPPNNSLLVVVVFGQAGNGVSATYTNFTCSGGGLTFNRRVGIDNVDTSFDLGIAIFTAPVTTGASMTLAVAQGTSSFNVWAVSAFAYTGYDTSSPVGAIATGSDSQPVAVDGAYSITLNAAPAASSEVAAGLGMDKEVIGTTPGSAFTELHDLQSGASAGLETEVRTGSTSTTVDWIDTNTGSGSTIFAIAAAALEIKKAAGGTPSVDLSPLTFNVSQGTVLPTPSVALSPLTFNVSQGTVSARPSVGLSPLTFNVSQGTVLPAAIVDLSPLTFSLAQGTVLPAAIVGLSPLTFNVDLGAFGVGGNVSLSPITFSLALGQVSGRPSVGLAPITFSLAQGTVLPAAIVGLSPLTFTFALGTVSGRPSVGLSPLTFTMSLGSVSARPSVGLSPISFAVALGALSPAGVTPGAVSLAPITFNVDLGAVSGRPSVGLSPLTFAVALGSVSGQPTISLNPLTFVFGLGSVSGRPSVGLGPQTFTLGFGAFQARPSIGLSPITFQVLLGTVDRVTAPVEVVQLSPIAFLVRVRPLRPRALPVEYEFVVLLDRAPELVTIDRAAVDVRLTS
jgi:hypothetical protein